MKYKAKINGMCNGKSYEAGRLYDADFVADLPVDDFEVVAGVDTAPEAVPETKSEALSTETAAALPKKSRKGK